MIKKFMTYFFIFMFSFISVVGGYYFFRVYYLNKPIILKVFNKKISTKVQNYFHTQLSNSNYEFEIKSTDIEINKLPHLLTFKLNNLIIFDKTSSLKSFTTMSL